MECQNTNPFFFSSLPILRQLGFQDGGGLINDGDKLAMFKVWLTLEVRQFINLSVQDVSYFESLRRKSKY